MVAFGLFGGIAFSASYQLVARFANKNVIALGLGCSASGPLVLLLQLALEMGPSPTRRQQVGRQQLAPASAAAPSPERLHLPSLACPLAGGILWRATAPCSLPCASVHRPAGAAVRDHCPDNCGGAVGHHQPAVAPLGLDRAACQQAGAPACQGGWPSGCACVQKLCDRMQGPHTRLVRSLQDLTEPLLSDGQQREQTPGSPSAAAAAEMEEGEQFYTPAASPLRSSPHTPRTASQPPLSPTSPSGAPGTPTAGSQLTQLAASVWRQRSLPPLAAYPSLEPHQTFLSSGCLPNSPLPCVLQLAVPCWCASWFAHCPMPGALPHAADMEIGADFAATTLSDDVLLTSSREASETARGRAREREGSGQRQLSAPPTASGGGSPSQEAAVEAGRADGTALGTSKLPSLNIAVVASPSPPPPLAAAEELKAAAQGGSASWQALLLMWAPLAALTLSSTIALILFPLFTYVPTSGLLGESLPKVGRGRPSAVMPSLHVARRSPKYAGASLVAPSARHRTLQLPPPRCAHPAHRSSSSPASLPTCWAASCRACACCTRARPTRRWRRRG